MDITKVLLIFWSLQGGILIVSQKHYCVHQTENIHVVEGGSVTIPCSFSYPRENWDNTEISVYWKSGKNIPCGNNPFIYNHTEQWTRASYEGRISMVGNPEELRTASIRIQNLQRSDGPVFCCRVQIKGRTRSQSQKQSEEWQTRHGTHLRFPGQDWVDQLDVVPAFPGENVTIPCSVPQLPGRENIIESVTWRRGQSDLCSDHTIIFTWRKLNKTFKQRGASLVNFPQNVSLIIENVRSSDRGQYCCEVRTTGGLPYGSVHGTELAVVGSIDTPKLTVNQPQNILTNMGHPATINCSFTISDGTDLLWTGVYWRVGSPTGDYAYHPVHEMIHPTYRGRTDLTGQMDLHIQHVQETDFTTYYCMVILRECVGLNKVNTDIVHGRGTSLTMTAPPPSKWTLRAILAARFIVFSIVMVCGILGYRNVRRSIKLKD